MKVAALQMVSCPRRDDNLTAARMLLNEAAASGVELAVLPEYFGAVNARDTDKLALRESPGDGEVQSFLSQSARELGLWIVGGTLPMACDDPCKVRNTVLVYSPQGECVARYDKIHLFRFDNGQEHYDEGRTIEPGHTPVQFHVKSRSGRTWCVGLSVCYDLRFPELYRFYASAGADLLLVPSAFTYVTGQAHWELLLRARAVENLCGVVAAAQGGTHENGRRTWGHSMVIDAWGQVLAQRAEGAGVALAELGFAALAARRTQLPALGHRVM